MTAFAKLVKNSLVGRHQWECSICGCFKWEWLENGAHECAACGKVNILPERKGLKNADNNNSNGSCRRKHLRY